jgi:ABC-type lipoprotein release transport system permease subunit
MEGWMISGLGAIIGMSTGILLCVLQQQFGIIPMQGSSPDAFIVTAYPVELRFPDMAITFVTVLFIGYIAARFPVRYITRRYLADERLFA